MKVTMQVVPTTNAWDAPVYVYTSTTGETQVRRDGEDPGIEWRGGRGSRTSYPHAVVLIDGVMTEFDWNRQPDVLIAKSVRPETLMRFEELGMEGPS